MRRFVRVCSSGECCHFSFFFCDLFFFALFGLFGLVWPFFDFLGHLGFGFCGLGFFWGERQFWLFLSFVFFDFFFFRFFFSFFALLAVLVDFVFDLLCWQAHYFDGKKTTTGHEQEQTLAQPRKPRTQELAL